MKSIGIYNNLEDQLKLNNIKRLDLTEVLRLNPNGVTRKLSGKSKMTFDEAIVIRDYLQEKTGRSFELEYLFRKD